MYIELDRIGASIENLNKDTNEARTTADFSSWCVGGVKHIMT